MENLSDAALERRVVNEMPVSPPKTRNEPTRVPVSDNPRNGCGRTSSRLTYLAGLHVVSLACAWSQLIRPAWDESVQPLPGLAG
jgi:hypothetical protein